MLEEIGVFLDLVKSGSADTEIYEWKSVEHIAKLTGMSAEEVVRWAVMDPEQREAHLLDHYSRRRMPPTEVWRNYWYALG